MMGWTGGSAVLAEVGTIQMEFAFLSKYSGNPIYHDKALAIFKKLKDHKPPSGLYPIYVNADNGQFSRGSSYYTTLCFCKNLITLWDVDTVSLGALGDSFVRTNLFGSLKLAY
jgi:mannosyl-oligosaccharide alpha-1,2-mannosidase